KESWTPRQLSPTDKAPYHQRAVVPAMRDGQQFAPGEQRDLFVMVELSGDHTDTDDGWIYGTVSPDGKTVSSCGRVESCMGCHVEARKGRLFGLPHKTGGR